MAEATSQGDYNLHRTAEAHARLRRRYAAERRFRTLGLAAVLAAVAALLMLLSTVVMQGIPAFVLNYATFPIAIPASAVDPADPGSANYRDIVHDAVAAALPFAEGRAERKTARGLVSSGASLIVREAVIADPGLIGQTAEIPLPLSDTMDLYLKGLVVEKETVDVTGVATPSAADGAVAVALDAAATSRIRADISATLRRQAGRVSAKASRMQNAVDVQSARLENLEREMAGADAATAEAVQSEIATVQGELSGSRSSLDSLTREAQALIAEADDPSGDRDLGPSSPSYLLSLNGGTIKVLRVTARGIEGETLVPLQDTRPASAGEWKLSRLPLGETERQVSDLEIAYADVLVEKGWVSTRPNWIFFTGGASREAEMAGIWGAVVGSFLTLLVTLGLSFPLGVAAALYLEEFAPRNRWTSLIEVNINNLAAVPSIVFGLLGLAVFLNFFGLPRSAPLVGGMVLALMTLPTIIIASRAALRAVPPSIREAALGVGASKIQTVFHHVLPLAMPGMMTGTIIGMAQALGETAPLLMIGMVAFIVDVPGGFTEPATVLPVQIFMWADFPEQAFRQKTSAAIMVLLAFLILMNLIAVILRRRFERRW